VRQDAVLHYKIGRKLGEGGMGEVYLATDTKLDRQVALKFLPECLSSDSDARQRLLREARAASMLNHPSILTIHSIESLDDRDFIVMEYVDGQALGRYWRSVGPSPDDTLDLLTQIAEGLSQAHKAGVIHRDLKPDNILVASDGRVKILDFGMALLQGAAKLTKDGSTVGTAHYMAPEQVRGELADERSDIWALGVIIYEMLSGQTPFKGDYEAAVLYSVLNESYTPLSQICPKCPQALERVMQKALQKNPADRYQTVDELLADLSAARSAAPAATTLSATSASVAVLPFVNIGADPENEYFGDGLAEELIYALSNSRDLRVAARTSSFSFKGRDADVREIGRKLNVGQVLEGSVRKAGRRLRITVQLVDVATGYHLWSERFDREATDVFDIQDEITEAIVDRLAGGAEATTTTAVSRRHTADVEAHNCYLKGLFEFNRRTPDSLEQAIRWFGKAIRLDHTYAQAHAQLSLVHSLRCYPGFDIASPGDCYPQALDHAERALNLDSASPDALNALARVKMQFEWDWKRVEELWTRSLELAPRRADTLHQYADYLMFTGHFDDAIAAQKQALEFDPLSPIICANVARRYAYARQYETALREMEQALQLNPDYPMTIMIHALILYHLKRYDEVIAECQRIVNMVGPLPMPVWLTAYAAAAGRGVDGAQTEIDAFQKLANSRYLSPTLRGGIYVLLGRFDEAFEWLDRAYASHDPYMIFLKVEPLFDPLRADPRFTAISRKVGFP